MHFSEGMAHWMSATPEKKYLTTKVKYKSY